MKEYNSPVYVIDEKTLEKVDVIDEYKSLIWVERFREAGDFELYLQYSPEILSSIGLGRILRTDFSTPEKEEDIKTKSNDMVVEEIIVTNNEDGDVVIIRGRSILSLLDRRIVWGTLKYKGDLRLFHLELLPECCTLKSKCGVERYLPIIGNDRYYDIPEKIDIDKQYTGDNVYDIMVSIANEYKIGYHIMLGAGILSDAPGQMRYNIAPTMGKDVSEYVAFSTDFDNLKSYTYRGSNKNFKTIAKVDGEGEGASRIAEVVGNVSLTGLSRRELYVDARDVRRTTDSGSQMTDTEYRKKLKERGKQKLQEHINIKEFDAEVDPNVIYDYRIGDIVRIVSPYGIESKAQIIEIVTTIDTNGITVNPVFDIIEKED